MKKQSLSIMSMVLAGTVAMGGISATMLTVDTSAAEAAPSDVVSIPDAALADAINASLKHAAGTPITEADMDTLGYFEASDSGITNLTGLEYAHNMYYAKFTRNAISDISPLANSTALTRLYLDSNNLTDLSALAQLTGLTTLTFDSNAIDDVTPLSNLSNLTWLSFHNNNIADVAPLAGLTNVETMIGSVNQIEDLTPLSGLSGLRDLRLGDNNISDVSPLAALNDLSILRIASNDIVDLSPFAGLSNLSILTLSYNQIVDVSPLSGLTGLSELYLTSNHIADLTPLANVTVTAARSQTLAGPELYVPARTTSYTRSTPTGLISLPYSLAPEINAGALGDAASATWSNIDTAATQLTLDAASTDARVGEYSATITYPLVRADYTNTAPLNATVGTPYAFDFTVTPGYNAVSFALTNAGVDGLNLDAATGTLSGTPTTAGDYTVAIDAIDADGNAISYEWPIQVTDTAVLPEAPNTETPEAQAPQSSTDQSPTDQPSTDQSASANGSLATTGTERSVALFAAAGLLLLAGAAALRRRRNA
ncbi:leucine-rich repeat domain-containing protein [Lysinibacter cavernae]|uniref:LPXTG-motif cell wall-anchored protein n=1 Tax=Lysinibacter cavernae TaxID=1640652 RepID=A0A7X5TT51_9MICO|nr:leucine-rich repeat domain-containing protein [Lysinibacter cavernae]NIH52928.1 LPXTG-motif cell wall-anchored protein [Lysinibacter cavernae]